MRKFFLNILGGLNATKTTLTIPEIRKSIPAASTWKFAAMYVCSLWLLGGAQLSAKGASGHPESAWKVLAVGRIYVDLTAVGANNGTTWANAYTDLQNALAAAVSGDTIMVAAGTYNPDLAGPGNRTLSFGMKTGVVVLGGFPTGGGTLAYGYG